jgi:uncharacterized protein
MKIYTLKREQLVNRSPDEVFNFFEQPEKLAEITPLSLGFSIITPSPITMKTGALIDYTIRIMGIRWHWRTIISTYDPPHKFIDEQLMGPYAFWHHTHAFKQVKDGTLISDEVRYAIPLGILGRLAQALFVKRQLEHIFDYRRKTINQKFGG